MFKTKENAQELFSCLTSYTIVYEKMNINWRISLRCEGNDYPFESYMWHCGWKNYNTCHVEWTSFQYDLCSSSLDKENCFPLGNWSLKNKEFLIMRLGSFVSRYTHPWVNPLRTTSKNGKINKIIKIIFLALF